jgi:hypothetical protein
MFTIREVQAANYQLAERIINFHVEKNIFGNFRLSQEKINSIQFLAHLVCFPNKFMYCALV